MREMIATARYEYLMQIRWQVLWTVSVLLCGLVYFILLIDRGSVSDYYLSQPLPWKLGANLVTVQSWGKGLWRSRRHSSRGLRPWATQV
jgi:hypothetical protein